MPPDFDTLLLEEISDAIIAKSSEGRVMRDIALPCMRRLAEHVLIAAGHQVTRAEAKIIAARGLNANGNSARNAGIAVKHFLNKPYTVGTLLKTIRTIPQEA